jgi:hypothetical protein
VEEAEEKERRGRKIPKRKKYAEGKYRRGRKTWRTKETGVAHSLTRDGP